MGQAESRRWDVLGRDLATLQLPVPLPAGIANDAVVVILPGRGWNLLMDFLALEPSFCNFIYPRFLSNGWVAVVVLDPVTQ